LQISIGGGTLTTRRQKKSLPEAAPVQPEQAQRGRLLGTQDEEEKSGRLNRRTDNNEPK
jgi:hypothetical protein